MLLCHDLDDAVQALEQQPDGQVLTLPQCQHNPDVVFVFTEPSGRGYDVRPLQQLCAWNAFFHDQIEQCLQQLPAPLQGQLRRCLLPETPVPHPRLPAQAAQSAHFMAQYALARLWSSWGVRPVASIAPCSTCKLAACLDGTLALAEALAAAPDRPSAAAPWPLPPTTAKSGLLLMMGSGENLKPVSPYAQNSMLLPSLPDKTAATGAVVQLLQTLGRLYCSGVPIDWRAVHGAARPRRVPLPTYPFERRRYWFSEQPSGPAHATRQSDRTQDRSRPFYARPEQLNHPYVPPRNPLEQTLVDLCRELLGFERIGVCDNIVELGADSLFTMLLSRKVEQLFQLSISPHHLFREPTLASLAETIRAAGAVPVSAASPPQSAPDPELSKYLELLQQVEQMSDQQVEELLAKWSE
jgi:acyl transferase domain-containing protein